MLIVNQREMKECKGCGRMFLPKSRKEKYHSKQCSANTRKRKSRRKKERQVESN